DDHEGDLGACGEQGAQRHRRGERDRPHEHPVWPDPERGAPGADREMAQQHADGEVPAHQDDVLRGQRRAVLHQPDRDEQQGDQQIAHQGTQGTEHRSRVLTTARAPRGRACGCEGRHARAPTAPARCLDERTGRARAAAANYHGGHARELRSDPRQLRAARPARRHRRSRPPRRPPARGPACAERQRAPPRPRAAAEAAAGLNRYPDREALALRADLGAHLAAEAGIPAPEPHAVWAANGSNEIMHQLLLAYGGPGRTALGFTPHYSMYPEYARDPLTGWVTAERGPAPDFALSAEAVTAAIAEHCPSIVVLTSPNTPTCTALDLEVVDAAAAALAPTRGLLVVDEAYAEFRRDGV